ncbi:MAG: hypothetical protein FJ123_00060 [Deltaproteobacteria bacterium]|nr:hypothetical protein [Deltaproteobacteria bacterium]
MDTKKKVQLNLYVPEAYRNMLQRLAAQRMLENPKRAVSGSTIAAEILCEYLKKIDGTERSTTK